MTVSYSTKQVTSASSNMAPSTMTHFLFPTTEEVLYPAQSGSLDSVVVQLVQQQS